MTIEFLNHVRFTSCPIIEDSIYNHKIQAQNRLDYLVWLNNELIKNNINNDFSKIVKQEITSLKFILNKEAYISQI